MIKWAEAPFFFYRLNTFIYFSVSILISSSLLLFSSAPSVLLHLPSSPPPLTSGLLCFSVASTSSLLMLVFLSWSYLHSNCCVIINPMILLKVITSCGVLALLVVLHGWDIVVVAKVGNYFLSIPLAAANNVCWCCWWCDEFDSNCARKVLGCCCFFTWPGAREMIT